MAGSVESMGNLAYGLYSPYSTATQRAEAIGTVAVSALAAPFSLGIGSLGIAYGLAPYEASFIGSTAGGAFGNVAFTAGSSAIAGQKVTPEQLAISAGVGAVAAGITSGISLSMNEGQVILTPQSQQITNLNAAFKGDGGGGRWWFWFEYLRIGRPGSRYHGDTKAIRHNFQNSGESEFARGN